MTNNLNVLIVEDLEDDAILLVLELRRSGFQVDWERVESAEDLQTALTKRSWDLVISAYHLPNFSAPEALTILKNSPFDLPFIVVSGTIGEISAVELMRQGASDYLMKGHLIRLPEVVRRELREVQIRAERKRNILELDYVKERLRLAIEGSGIGLWDWLVQAGEVEINDRWAAILGYSLEELQPLSVETFHHQIHPEDFSRVKITLEQHFQRETNSYECEFRLRHKLGGWVWVLSKGKVVKWDEDGKPLRMLGTNLDISGRKQSVEMLTQLNETLEERVKQRTLELKKSEASLREAQQIAHLGSWELNIHTHQIAWSSELFRILGLESDLPEPSYEESLNFLVEEDRPKFLNLINEAIQFRESKEIDVQIRRVDGSMGYILLRGKALANSEGLVTHVVGIAMDISDRKQVELQRQQLLQEVSSIKLALDQTAIVAITDKKGTITYANERFIEISGYSKEELLGQTHRIVKSGYHPSSFFKKLWRTISSGEIWRGEICNRRKNGSLYWVETAIVPFLDSQGTPFQYLTIRFDMTARKLAQAALHKENTFRHQIVENMTEGLCVCHEIEEFPFLRFTVWNQQMQLITGYSLFEINRFGWDQSLYPTIISSPQFEPNIHALELQTKTGDRPTVEEWEIKRKDGQIRKVSIARSMLSNEEGKAYLLSLIQDITDRKLNELRLQQKVNQESLLTSITQRIRASLNLSEILNATVEEIHQCLQTDRVLVYRVFAGGTGSAIAEAVSAGWTRVLDIAFPEEVFPEINYDRYVQGRIYSLNDSLDPEQYVLPCLIEFLQSIQVRAKLVVPIVFNQKLWGLLIAHQCDRPRQWQSGEIDLLKQIATQLAIAIQQSILYEQLQQELSIRQQAEAQLTETNQKLAISNEELIRATRLKDEFLANMSHELRTPLNAILGMTEGLQEGVFGVTSDRQIKALQTIERSGMHLLSLINDILDVAKIESGQMTLDLEMTSLQMLCKSSISFVKQQADKKSIQLVDNIPNALPDLLIDERKMRQVLINLLNNAVKFTPEGGRIILEVTVTPSSEHLPSSYVQIAVIDTGIGISPENINKLFQPFIQIDSALNRQYVGTGLGLALVKRLTEMHGGKIGLTSEVGVGSCFMVRLPYDGLLKPVNSSTPEPQIADSHDSDNVTFSPSPQQLPLILLAEDNEANISTITCYFEAKGYRMILAHNGEEAIAMAKEHHPDLILMDVQMPVLDGLEATRQIRHEPALANTPIIALTALAMTGDREKCLEAGVNDYLPKPIKLKNLSRMIQSLLNQP
ncbi:PAS domain-containing protein [Pseudanabaena sp. FACHB-1998]|uniref:PAS domain-containing protein n=1 Tax=Pseudanabaena sp. FACHB-1998 TaxID=2692858 RepID=UPI001681A586|nr:PAS domain-containing protein [Pseudanabaena sp. FACHB-1998]MBD2178706.1 PAS domain-containing protein [Pseudanabaena sp. FACHB-1998]